jgi:hypothetical protein
MPSEIEAYGDTTLFGIRILFDANRQDVLDMALNLFPQSESGAAINEAISIYVVLRTYDVKASVPERMHLAPKELNFVRDGIFVQADGERGRGACVFPSESAASEEVREAISTLTLFLVAQADRVPVHASAVMFGDTAVVLAGQSGAGKSVITLAANRKGLPVLSDDTVYVQTKPAFQVWARARAIHVLEKDAPGETGEMRFRSARWKRAVPIAQPRSSARRSVLCVLHRGARISLARLGEADAVDALTRAPEPGFDVYGEQSAAAVRALAAGGCWRLTLADDPDRAVTALMANFAEAATTS